MGRAAALTWCRHLAAAWKSIARWSEERRPGAKLLKVIRHAHKSGSRAGAGIALPFPASLAAMWPCDSALASRVSGSETCGRESPCPLPSAPSSDQWQRQRCWSSSVQMAELPGSLLPWKTAWYEAARWPRTPTLDCYMRKKEISIFVWATAFGTYSFQPFTSTNTITITI